MSLQSPAAAPPRRTLLAVGLMLFCGITWGSTYVFAKIATEGGTAPLGLAFWQGLGGALFLLPICLLRGKLPRLRLREGAFYLVTGALGTALPSIVWFWSAPHLPAGIIAIVTAFVPLVTLALTLGLRIERFAVKRLIGILFGLAAILLVVLPDTSLPDHAMVGWVLFALLIPVCYATESVFINQRRPEGMDSLTLLCGMLFGSTALLIVPTAVTGAWIALPFPWGEVEWSIVALIGINILSYALFIELIRIAGPVFAVQMGYVNTVAGVGWGWILLGERLSDWVWIALAVLFCGLALVRPGRAD